MPLPGTSIHVEEGWVSTRVVWPDPKLAPVELDPWWKWRNRKLDLYAPDAGQRMLEIGRIGSVAQGLAFTVVGYDGPRILPIIGGKIADQMPWEALEREFLYASLHYHPVRLAATARAVPVVRPGPLRAAILVGHEGPGKEFDRDRELAALKNAFSASAQVRAQVATANNIATLDLSQIDSDLARRAFFRDADPHVVIYFGHGRANGVPAVRDGPGPNDWLKLKKLAKLAVNEHPFPVSWVFIACSIGEDPSPESGPAGLTAFQILAKHGARTMLAMRSRIRPHIARVVAASLIESLSAGTPLELAAATARKTARRMTGNENVSFLDWAALAVWTTAAGPLPPRGAPMPPELMATKLTRTAVGDLGIGLIAPALADTQIATRWLGQRRVRVDISRENSTSISAHLGKIAGAMGALSGRPSLFVRIRSAGPYVARLSEWAESVLGALDSAERETLLGQALQQLKMYNLAGLETLLGIPGMAAIFSAPPAVSEDTVWALLEGAPADSTVVLGYTSVHQEHRLGWVVDGIRPEDAMGNMPELLDRNRRTLAILAVVEEPINENALPLITGERMEALGTRELTISMPSGVVLTAGARSSIRAALGHDDLAAAHRLAFEARQSVPALIESDDIFAPVRHLVGADAPELTDFVNALAAQSSTSWTEVSWLNLARALEPARHRWGGVDPKILLKIADVLVARQTLAQATLWLDEVDTDDPELGAWQLYLRSEIAKAAGTPQAQERMWRFARDSLQRLEEATAASPADRRLRARLREMRGNLARLELYFHHDALAARDIWISILDELNSEPEVDVATALVATLRNLAECLFEFEPFRSEAASRTEARRHLTRAYEVAQRQQVRALGAEVLYSAAKLDETERDWPAARDHLTAAAELAHSAGHVVCLRISEMRVFWLGVRREGLAFDSALFTVRLRKLEFLESHAWARRYAAQSRIWAAYELERAGDQAGMRRLLRRAIASFEPLSAVSPGSDRRFVALSYAGLATSEAIERGGDARNQESWMHFAALEWAPAWIQDQAMDNPLEYWRGDV